MSQDTRCPECLAFGGCHTWSCQSVPEDQKAAHMERYARTFLNGQEQQRQVAARCHSLIVFWHGKYTMVKEENNALRRKLSRQEKQQKVAE